MEPVAVQVEDLANAIVMHVKGQVDMASAVAFVGRIEDVRERDRLGRGLVLDLLDVTFFSSSGVAALAIFSTTCATHAVELRVVPTQMIRQVLSISGADLVVELAETVDEAIASLANA